MKADVIILGASGYGGGELLRLLSNHPAAGAIMPVSKSNAGKCVTEVHSHLRNLSNVLFLSEPDWRAGSQESPLVIFAAMENGRLASLIGSVLTALEEAQRARRAVLIDLSGDFRLRSADAYRAAYGCDHPRPDLLGSFTYGLPEAGAIAQARCIANPGCFATAVGLALLPLASIENIGFIAVSGCTGSSGSGFAPSAVTHHPARAHDFRAYAPLAHRHQPEVEMLLRDAGARGVALSFVPHSAPIVRGIFVTAQFRLPLGLDGDGLAELVKARYADSTFIRLINGSPRIATVAGSNYAEIGVAVKDGNAAIMCAIDNLGKGMAGQAVQNMNIALGLDETTGLMQQAVYP